MEKIANTVEKIGRKLTEMWYVDLAIALAGSILIIIAYRMRKSKKDDEEGIL